MISPEPVLWVGLLFAACALLAAAVWLLRTVWVTRSERRLASTAPGALATIAASLQDRRRLPGTAIALRRLPREDRIAVLTEMAHTVADTGDGGLRELARGSGVMADAERWARSRRWTRRLRAARLLKLFGSGDEPLAPRLLADRRWEVRAEAAESLTQTRDPERIEVLVAMLGDPSPACQFTASETLRRIGTPAVGPLAAALDSAHGTQAMRTMQVARLVAGPVFLAAASRLVGAPEAGVRQQACALLGAIGGSEATAALIEHLDDPSPEVRAAAAAGLGKLGHWPSAARIADLLDDPGWRVRRTAAESLRRLGPSGELLLGRAARAADSRGSSMARYALSVGAESRAGSG